MKDWYADVVSCAKTGQPATVSAKLSDDVCKPQATQAQTQKIHSAIDDLQAYVRSNSALLKQSELMWDDVPLLIKENNPSCLGSFDEVMSYSKIVLVRAPAFTVDFAMVGVMFRDMLQCYFTTVWGQSFFGIYEVNQRIGKIVEAWGEFLDSEASRKGVANVLYGWQTDCAQKFLNITDFLIDEDSPAWGFRSFNDFFMRQVNMSMRPLTKEPIAAFGDTQFYACQKNLTLTMSSIQAKAQKYSPQQILGAPAQDFEGGMAVQAFFSSLWYHRYHAPCTGVVERVTHIPGLFFPAQTGMYTSNAEYHDVQQIDGYVSTRAVVILQCNGLGRVGFVPIGMESVSSVNITVEEGQSVRKGDQLGTFAFGGSTAIMFLQKDAASMFECPREGEQFEVRGDFLPRDRKSQQLRR